MNGPVRTDPGLQAALAAYPGSVTAFLEERSGEPVVATGRRGSAIGSYGAAAAARTGKRISGRRRFIKGDAGYYAYPGHAHSLNAGFGQFL